MSLQVGREPLGLELRPCGLTQVATRRTQVGGRPALRLNGLLEPKRELRPRRRILLSEIVAAQRLLNLMVEHRQGRLEVGEDGQLKVIPIHGGAKAGSEGA